MKADVILRKAGRKGKGVFAMRLFRRGERLLEITGSPLTKRTEYSIQLGRMHHMNPIGPARYMNHSCEPNCGIIKLGRRVFFVALKTITKGSELVWDYVMSEYEFDWFMRCLCKAKTCRKWIGGWVCLDATRRKKYVRCLMPYLRTVKIPELTAKPLWPHKNIYILYDSRKNTYTKMSQRKALAVLRSHGASASPS